MTSRTRWYLEHTWVFWLVMATVLFAWGIYAQMQAISERRLNAAFMQVLKESNSAFILLDHRGRVNAWSQGAVEMFGLTEDRAMGMPLDPIIPFNLRQQHQASFDAESASTGCWERPRVVSTRAIGSDHREFDALVTIWRVEQDHTPKFLAWVCDKSKQPDWMRTAE